MSSLTARLRLIITSASVAVSTFFASPHALGACMYCGEVGNVVAGSPMRPID